MSTSSNTKQNINLLLLLSLAPQPASHALSAVAVMGQHEREELLRLAQQHHVNVRVLEVLARQMGSSDLSGWACALLDGERRRRQQALAKLQEICDELEAENCPVTVIKSLDHLPDLGSDFDLYTSADEDRVIELLLKRFDAGIEPRSWGDRLAHKWNFVIPGISEAVEVHMGRLGQTGEHIVLARRFSARRVRLQVEQFQFHVPAAEERIIAATLQRIYRHFFFRICDIVNAAKILRSGALDFAELKKAADLAGIWPGVATYLTVVTDMVKKYGAGVGIALPGFVEESAWFREEKLYVSNMGFFRFPILPDAAGLYLRQLTRTAAAGNVAATLRLSLLPPLASVAGLATKLVGSDKGIW